MEICDKLFPFTGRMSREKTLIVTIAENAVIVSFQNLYQNQNQVYCQVSNHKDFALVVGAYST